MLMCTPGGCQEMSLMADDLNCDAPKIVIIHTIRIFCVITFFPNDRDDHPAFCLSFVRLQWQRFSALTNKRFSGKFIVVNVKEM